jgi:hypothetical protein
VKLSEYFRNLSQDGLRYSIPWLGDRSPKPYTANMAVSDLALYSIEHYNFIGGCRPEPEFTEGFNVGAMPTSTFVLLSTDSKTAQSARKPFTSDGRNSFHSPGLQCNITSVRPKSNDRLIHRVFLKSSMIPSRKDSSLSGHSLSYGSMKTSSGPELCKW